MPKGAFADVLSGAGSGAITGAGVAGPKGAAVGAGIGALLSFFQQRPKFNDARYRKAFDRARNILLKQSNQQAKEYGAQLGTDFAGRRIGGAMRDAIIYGNRQQSERAMLEAIALAEADFEIDLANAEAQIDQQKADRINRNLANLANQGSHFARDLFNPSPFRQDPPGFNQIRQSLGIEVPEPFDYEKFFNIGGRPVERNSPLGQLFSINQKWLEALASKWSGGLEGMYEVLGGNPNGTE